MQICIVSSLAIYFLTFVVFTLFPISLQAKGTKNNYFYYYQLQQGKLGNSRLSGTVSLNAD